LTEGKVFESSKDEFSFICRGIDSVMSVKEGFKFRAYRQYFLQASNKEGFSKLTF